MFNKEFLLSKGFKGGDLTPWKATITVAENNGALGYYAPYGSEKWGKLNTPTFWENQGITITSLYVLSNGDTLKCGVMNTWGDTSGPNLLTTMYIYRPDTYELLSCTFTESGLAFEPGVYDKSVILNVNASTKYTLFTQDDVGKNVDIYLFFPSLVTEETYPTVFQKITVTGDLSSGSGDYTLRMVDPNGNTIVYVFSKGVDNSDPVEVWLPHYMCQNVVWGMNTGCLEIWQSDSDTLSLIDSNCWTMGVDSASIYVHLEDFSVPGYIKFKAIK